MPGKRLDQTSNTAWAARRPFSNLGFQAIPENRYNLRWYTNCARTSERVDRGIPIKSDRLLV